MIAQDMDIPGFIREYLYSLDPGYEITRVIRDKYPRLILRVKINGRDCLVKAVRGLTLWKRPGRYFRFQKEIFIYRRLDRLDFKHFKHPRLLNTDGKRILVTEYIENQASLPMDESFHERALKAVLELNTCDFPFHAKGGAGWFWEKINRWKFSRSTKTMRHLLEGFLIKRNISFRLLVSGMALWCRSFGESRKITNPVLLHRDIYKPNVLRPSAGNFFFIDFEKAGLEKRWVLSDALKLAYANPLFFQNEAGKMKGFPRFRVSLLKAHWNTLVKRRPELLSRRKNFKIQLRFCLFAWTIKMLVKETNPADQEQNLVQFLDNVILGPDESFEDWVRACP